jgi:hypothetical protein
MQRATFENASQPAVGMQTLLVSSRFVVRDGNLGLDAPHGQPVRRFEPSPPANTGCCRVARVRPG